VLGEFAEYSLIFGRGRLLDQDIGQRDFQYLARLTELLPSLFSGGTFPERADVEIRDLRRRRGGFLEDLQALSIDLVVAGLHQSRHLSGMRQGVI
jgi:hypothetical protein